MVKYQSHLSTGKTPKIWGTKQINLYGGQFSNIYQNSNTYTLGFRNPKSKNLSYTYTCIN